MPEEEAARAADLVATAAAGGAPTARDRGLHRNAVADVDAPPLRGAIADALHDPERLVTRDDREAHREDAGVLLCVAAADPARFDADEAAVVVDVGDRQLAQLEAARRGLDDGPARARRHGGIKARSPANRPGAVAPTAPTAPSFAR